MYLPQKLKKGDLIRLIAPSGSYAIVNSEQREIARRRFEEDLGLKISFGVHVEEIDEFKSSSIESRLTDLHEAFLDDEVKGIICIEGGFNSNQLLPYVDWDLIKSHPKIFVGYSDITVLNNAILIKTGMISYSGPMYSTMGMKKGYEYMLLYFKKCLMEDGEYEIVPGEYTSDDDWEGDQENRTFTKNEGVWVINEGVIEGEIVGGNLSSLALLFGTEYMPSLENKILFLEEDYEWQLKHVDRCITGLTQTPYFENVMGIVWGRFEGTSGVSRDNLIQMTKNNEKLKSLPMIGNVDFGHANPKATIPIGGKARIEVAGDRVKIIMLTH